MELESEHNQKQTYYQLNLSYNRKVYFGPIVLTCLLPSMTLVARGLFVRRNVFRVVCRTSDLKSVSGEWHALCGGLHVRLSIHDMASYIFIYLAFI